MDEETVPPQEDVEAVVEQAEVNEEVEEQQEPVEEKKIPLSAHIKERRRRQELEVENRLLREQSQKKTEPEPEEDNRFESATKEDLANYKQQIIRDVEERSWIKANPERYERVNRDLSEFLKLRPNLTSAINGANNRFEEAWDLMNALTPKEQKTIAKPAVKKEAPGSPSSVPKAAAMNQAVDVMGMSDREFHEWRKAQKKR